MSEQVNRHITFSKQYANKLEQYSLPLRGDNINPIIDAATPLLGMILRIQDLSTPIDDPEYLYRQIVIDIQGIEQQLELSDYEPGITVTFRYVLCTFIDECIMSSELSLAKYWSQKSLLIHFHNEGWGGEKIFQILERLMNEPKRYKDMLEFFYLCFCLGLRGRYKVQNPNSDEFDRLLRRLNAVLQTLNPPPGQILLHQQSDTHHSAAYHLPKQLTIKHILLAGVAALVAVYAVFLIRLNIQSTDILEQLNTLLQ